MGRKPSPKTRAKRAAEQLKAINPTLPVSEGAANDLEAAVQRLKAQNAILDEIKDALLGAIDSGVIEKKPHMSTTETVVLLVRLLTAKKAANASLAADRAYWQRRATFTECLLREALEVAGSIGAAATDVSRKMAVSRAIQISLDLKNMGRAVDVVDSPANPTEEE